MEHPVVIVTGAGRGIGRAAALELGRAGYRLAICSRTLSQLQETLALAGGGLALPADVSDPKQAASVVSRCVQTAGRVDAVVHCAGVAPVCGIAEMTDEQWRQVIDTNLSAAFYLCRAAWPIFQRQRSGVVVNISSVAARDPFTGFAAYGAAKAGLNLFGLALAREGEAIGVRVHTIAPAAVETVMFRQILSAEQYAPQKTLDPADVARVILQCVRGDLRHASGEVIYLHKTM